MLKFKQHQTTITARYYVERSYAMVSNTSVRLSVCDVGVSDHIALKFSKIIPRFITTGQQRSTNLLQADHPEFPGGIGVG